MLFQPFKSATGRKGSAAEDEINKAKFSNLAKQQANSLRSGNALGAAELYNAGMGDKSPIADSLFGVDEVGAANPELMSKYAGAAEAAAPSLGGASAGVLGGAEAAIAAETAGAVGAAPVLASTAAPSAAPALSAMGPAGWAALAGLLLTQG